MVSGVEQRLLLERETEVAALDRALEAAAGSDGVLVVLEGPPGAGKSTLLRHAGEAALGRGMRVLTAVGAEMEQEFAFGVVRQLFAQVAGGLEEPGDAPGIGAAARLALPLLRGADVGPGSNVQSVLYGLSWLAADLAADSGLALVVDDAHWADDSSLRFLTYLLSRLVELPVALLLALRPNDADARSEQLTSLRAYPHATVLRPAPLSDRAVCCLLSAALGEAPDDRVVAAVGDVTGGNPFLVRELTADLARDQRAGVRATPDRVSTAAPGGVRLVMAARLAALSPSARELAQAVAVLGNGTPMRQAAALADLDPDRAGAAADELAAASLLEPADPLAFLHPLIRSVCRATIPRAACAAMHLQAARRLDADGEPLERIAAQLLEARRTGDPWVVETLERAARHSAARGAPETAARLLQRALEEPPGREERTRVLVELGRAQLAAGDAAAAATLDRAVEALSEDSARASVLDALGRALFAQGRIREASTAFARAVVALDQPDSREARELQARYANTALMHPETRADAQEHMKRLLAMPAGEMTPGERSLAAFLAMGSALAGEPGPATAALTARALAAGRPIDLADPDEGMAAAALAVALLYRDELDASEAMLDAALDEARRQGHVIAFATVSYLRAWPRYFRGELQDAIADAEQALDSGRHGWRMFATAACAVLAHAHMDRGDLDAAQRAIAAAPPESVGAESGEWTILLEARGRLRHLCRDPTAALQDLLLCGELLRRAGFATRPTLWRAQAAVLCARLGDHERAAVLIADERALAERVAVPRMTGMVLRAAGLVTRDPDERLALLGAAVETLRTSPSRLELARALVDPGAALRRTGRRVASREPLAEARTMAHRFGARALLETATAELAATGARPRRIPLSGVDALTASERRVAQMAASGLGNREIAEALFVTRKAVEFHLSNTYRKLDIGSRNELAAALGTQPSAPPEE